MPIDERSDSDLWLLVYVSTAAREFSDAELEDLLIEARRNNAALQVTGLLAYHDGTFMQAIEGPRAVVEQLYREIERDHRHSAPLVLLRRAIEARQFAAWRMAYRRVRAEDAPEGFSGLMQSGADGESFAGHTDRVHRLLQNFADTQLRRPR